MDQEEVSREIKKKNRWNENEKGILAKTVLRGKFILLNAYIKKEKSQISNWSSLLKNLEEEQNNPKEAKGRK